MQRSDETRLGSALEGYSALQTSARLRHSFASVAAMGQMSLLNIGAYSVPSCIKIFDLFRATKTSSLVGTYKI